MFGKKFKREDLTSDILYKLSIEEKVADSLIGNIASTILGASETTLYVIAIYTSTVGIKKTRFVLASSLFADFVGIVTAVVIWRIMS